MMTKTSHTIRQGSVFTGKFTFALILTLTLLYAISVSATEDDLYEGLIEPFELIDLGSPTEGIVESINVERSSIVKKGMVLAQLESSVERALVKRAKALYESQGEINLQQERLAYAQRIYERIRELFENEAVSAEKMDEAATEVQLAKAQLVKAQEDRELARLDLKRAEAVLERRSIRSPINGVVVEKYIATGELVGNQPLLKLARMNPLRIEVILPAEMFDTIKTGMTAEVTPEVWTDKTRKATVTVVDKVLDPASGTFGIQLELANPDNTIPGGLRCTLRFLPEIGQQKSQNTVSSPADTKK